MQQVNVFVLKIIKLPKFVENKTKFFAIWYYLNIGYLTNKIC